MYKLWIGPSNLDTRCQGSAQSAQVAGWSGQVGWIDRAVWGWS